MKGNSMKPLTFINIIIIFGTLSLDTTNAQSPERPPLSLNAHLGSFITAQDKFEQTYDSKVGFAIGGGVGLSLSQHLALIADATYFAKSGVPEIINIHYDLETGAKTIVSKQRIGTAKFRQLIFNGGLQYKVSLSDLYDLGLALGASYSTVSEDIKSPNFSMSLSGTGAFGYFGGVSLERRLESSPFALFAGLQYSHAQTSVFFSDRNYGGVNFSVGAKFYFSYRK